MSPRRIYAAVFGSGLGHASRVLEIARGLEREGEHLFFSSFAEGYDFLKRNSEPVVDAPSIRMKWDEEGGFSGKETLVNAPLSILDFWRQVGFEMRCISKFNPKLVISDSRLSAVFAAKSRFLPVVTILNQFKILFPPRFRAKALSSLYERIAGDALASMWSLSDKILIPDLPPPYTLSEENVSHVDVACKLNYVGFMIPRTSPSEENLARVQRLLGIDERPLVFVQISGPAQTKSQFLNPALEASEALARDFNVVISKGDPKGATLPIKLAKGAWLYEWCPVKDELLAICDVLVARSGHTTLSQCINAGKPAVVVPIFNHSEQIWNAEKFAKLGAGLGLNSSQLKPQSLADAVRRCYSDPRYRFACQRLKKVSDKLNGVERAKEIVKSFL